MDCEDLADTSIKYCSTCYWKEGCRCIIHFKVVTIATVACKSYIRSMKDLLGVP